MYQLLLYMVMFFELDVLSSQEGYQCTWELRNIIITMIYVRASVKLGVYEPTSFQVSLIRFLFMWVMNL